MLTEHDQWLFNEGSHARLADVLGAHLLPGGGVQYAVWAPAATSVSVISEANSWMPGVDRLEPEGGTGIWAGVVRDARVGDRYKFHIRNDRVGFAVDKADPVAFAAEQSPRTASIVTDLTYAWGDAEWMANRHPRNRYDAPMSVYEVHLGSWRHAPDELRSLNYLELAEPLADHVTALGFTHVEFLPIMEYPYYGSWGYQTTGYFAPTSRFGGPTEFMALIDHLHQRGIGVILDWVPSHFATDVHGLALFDGTHLFEHADPRQGFHPDWGSCVFNYDRHEVRSFLLSSASFWCDRYHVDGIRVDAVASMLYLDYSRGEGEWVPNEFGGNENMGALRFLKQLNESLYLEHPDIQTTAEESTAWPMVSRPTSIGGLGFGFKWDMGWMHDTLEYFSLDPIYRSHHHHLLTFRMLYAFSENYVLPLSHDEVVHGKGSLLGKMPGDRWQRFANLRMVFGLQYGHAGKKLVFMGSELAPENEWDHDHSLPWELGGQPAHAGVQRWLTTLNELHRSEPALHVADCEPEGFRWVSADGHASGVIAFLRLAPGARPVLVVANATPVPRDGWRVGVPQAGHWIELANSDGVAYGGSGMGNEGAVAADDVPYHALEYSLDLVLPPLSVVMLAPVSDGDAG